MNVERVKQLLAQVTGYGSWVVFETNTFGFVDREHVPHQRGHMTDPQDAGAIVDLLNSAPEMLENQSWLDRLDQVPSATGIRVKRTAESVIDELASLRRALREALDLPDGDPRRHELRRLCK